MGNQEIKVPDQMSSTDLEVLCSLIGRDYTSPNCINFDPFLSRERIIAERVASPILNEIDFQISQMVDEVETTQTPFNCQQQEQLGLLQGIPVPITLTLQKNQSHKRKMIKKKSQSNQPKKSRRVLEIVESEVDDCQPQQMGEQNDVQEMRDQNNCKSYHKLVKNYLVSKKLGHLLQPYQKYYATKFYFVIALMIIKHHLKEDFTEIYQRIAEKEVQVQQAKIQKKTAELSKIRKQIRQGMLNHIDCSALQLGRDKLVRQIAHIRVLKHYIGNYSTRSCAAFFQGNTEESLRILYLKDDAEMKKRYYFLEAWTVLQQIETQVRKVQSHA